MEFTLRPGLSPCFAPQLGLKILDAVEEVHEAGWIHRDVKPANLVVQAGCRGLDDAVIHLCDFGLARKFRGDDGSHVGERERAQFRGSTGVGPSGRAKPLAEPVPRRGLRAAAGP